MATWLVLIRAIVLAKYGCCARAGQYVSMSTIQFAGVLLCMITTIDLN